MNIYTSKTEAAAKAAFKAAASGDRNILQELVDHQFNLEDCDECGNSVLHYAVEGGDLEMVRFLVETGGLSPAWANQALVTPYDLAHVRSAGKGNICEIERYFQTVCGFAHDQCYRNPICRGMHPDPSIVRVEDDYYMVNSSFVYFPGIPISHSCDLVHWQVIGYAITDPAWADEHLGPLEGGRGFWAPDISYHKGRFYICATLRLNDDAPCIQTQIVTSSERPAGPYEPPVIHPVRGIDPSIFTDDDGRRYMLLNRGARLMEISEDGTRCLTKPQMIWYGSSKHAPEGPHLLKKDGYYYCFLAEGGTGKGHMVTVARSKQLYGPYEDCPYNPILSQTDAAGVLQCCGHGKPVSTPDGRWFMVYLCSRFLDGKWGMLGRETALDEIVWTPDGWPVIKGGRKPTAMAPLPFWPEQLADSIGANDIRVADRSTAWMAPRTIDPERIQVKPDGMIRIMGDGRDLCDRRCRSLLIKWQPDFNFETEFEMILPPPDNQGHVLADSEAGVTLYYDENTFVKFGVTAGQAFVKEYIGEGYVRQETVPFDTVRVSVVRLKVVTAGLRRSFWLNGIQIGMLDNVTCLCSEGFNKGKRFTGAAYGVYVYGKDSICWRQYGCV
ncbi:MAG: family 43 glycosylhydrolase [Lachnospiraceae bacterium]